MPETPTPARKLYAYRLVVEYPEGVDWRNPPEGWEPTPIGPDDESTFAWPQRLRYLSKSGAEGRADLLRGWGCKVAIERSNEITWPSA